MQKVVLGETAAERFHYLRENEQKVVREAMSKLRKLRLPARELPQDVRPTSDGRYVLQFGGYHFLFQHSKIRITVDEFFSDELVEAFRK